MNSQEHLDEQSRTGRGGSPRAEGGRELLRARQGVQQPLTLLLQCLHPAPTHSKEHVRQRRNESLVTARPRRTRCTKSPACQAPHASPAAPALVRLSLSGTDGQQKAFYLPSHLLGGHALQEAQGGLTVRPLSVGWSRASKRPIARNQSGPDWVKPPKSRKRNRQARRRARRTGRA